MHVVLDVLVQFSVIVVVMLWFTLLVFSIGYILDGTQNKLHRRLAVLYLTINGAALLAVMFTFEHTKLW